MGQFAAGPLLLAALNGFLAIAAGAFGAHAAADPVFRELLRTGAQYQMVHAAAAVAALALVRNASGPAIWAAWLFGAGGLVFAGSLDLLGLLHLPILGAVTPLGGVLMMAGWAALGWGALSGTLRG